MYPVLCPSEYQNIARSLCWRAQKCRRRYRRLAARNELILRSQWLIDIIANKFKNITNLSHCELVSEGQIALIDSIEEYDFTLGVRFTSYAGKAISNAICNAIFENKHIIRIPLNHRSIKKGDPYYNESVRASRVFSTDPKLMGPLADNRRQPLTYEEKEFIDWSISHLNIREKNIISLYFFESMTHKEISKKFKLTRQRVTQLHSCAVRKMNVAAQSVIA